MSQFSDLRASARLSITDAQALLNLSVETVAAYESGTRLPAAREIQILKGLALARIPKSAKKEPSEAVLIRSPATIKTEDRADRGQMSKSKIPTLSLFSGAGGLDLGFKEAGFKIVGCVEIDAGYCATLSANADKGTIVHCKDIRKFDAKPYRKAGIRCVIGGPPCQTFSAAGRRAGGVIGIEDERGQLFRAYCQVLQELKPEVFIFENVYGLPGANGGGPWRAIVKEFSKLGYRLSAEVVDAADYGVPQHRERLFLVGYRKGQFTFPMPTHGPDSRDQIALVSVEKAIADLQNKDEPYHDNLGGLYGH